MNSLSSVGSTPIDIFSDHGNINNINNSDENSLSQDVDTTINMIKDDIQCSIDSLEESVNDDITKNIKIEKSKKILTLLDKNIIDKHKLDITSITDYGSYTFKNYSVDIEMDYTVNYNGIKLFKISKNKTGIANSEINKIIEINEIKFYIGFDMLIDSAIYQEPSSINTNTHPITDWV